ncbi:DUF4302 domain-containing protein [Pedobacter frigiditerrae]|uniref:DUF4302 domain-containing protein n=1 Tax=Pedobacter frigiditerrae TaxID=2530452 RepID=UPI0029313F63|nr:DUF4302 domain-containing protein [Pedobacter frigiditerrae]
MKKLFYLLFFAAIVFVGCKKSSFESVFDKNPEERMADAISLVNTSLTSSPNGWIATLPTSAGGGYGFYMSFDANQNVIMYSDISDAASTTPATSTYRVTTGLGAMLAFDTYNYISVLQDPKASVYGGTQGSGFSSDVEFTYVRQNADSLFFVGRQYRQPLVMVKATAAQKASYVASAYKTTIDKLKSFFTTNKNPFIEIVSGTNTLKVGVTPNLTNTLSAGKRLDLTGVLADGNTVVSSGQKIASNIDGIDILGTGLIWQGIKFVRLRWKDATTLVLIDGSGKEYIIKNSATPLVPLYQLWGTKYTGMLSEYKTIYPGTSANGAVILNYYHNGLVPPTQPYTFNYGRINFVWNTVNKRLTVNGFSSQNGGTSGWVTATVYSYTVDGAGVYKFTSNAIASGGYVAIPLSKLDTFLLQNRVTFDYHVDGANVYAKVTSVEDPSTVMTFVLQ